MVNMARERRECGCRSTRSLIFIAILSAVAFDLTGVNAAAAGESDPSLYEYHASDVSLLDQELVFHLESSPRSFRTLDRRRRMAVQPQADMESPTKPQTPHQDPLISTKTNASVKVSYSTTEKNATVATSTVKSAMLPSSVGPSTTPNNDKGKGVIVSTPIVPPIDKNATKTANASAAVGAAVAGDKVEKPVVNVWANQTLWPNATKQKVPSEQGVTELDDFIGKYPTDVTNKTLHDNNVTKTETDTHQYYNSTFSTDEAFGRRYWVDLDSHPDLQINTLLSKSHRWAATIKLKFDFPFYGHKVRNITIATGGFLYTGEYVHSWLAATQYIAPLMANFDTTLSPKSYVKYGDNGTAFTVGWENVHLQDKPEAGPFTFQVTLMQNGDIIFVYSKIPVLVENIEDKEHPVKIGLSDAYMMDNTVFFARRKTIYEYHRMNFNKQDIKNWTAIYLKALPTCLQMENCNDCLTKIKDFDCKWCSKLQKCSTGTFRLRQEWLQKGCDVSNIKELDKCPDPSLGHKLHDTHVEDHRTDDMPSMTKYSSNQAVSKSLESIEDARDNMNMGVSGIISILFIVSLIMGLAAWAAYAYRNPHTASGQMLIRYRPSQWSWRRGEARYTAATIHM
ncbi:plexin domain-containing protein 2 [Copidosoma floridanum]|uniref:plexin domain-containing protein 2 n=1 Tax=Copidosoma floridanum TaxID=29053 RepID=UPI0006C965A4|nr:plexin domain-containing protein 2 [Copidosoma floridanum]XP_014209382.1 plexin domain-containing protein 2 [Copidosoma floridanum]